MAASLTMSMASLAVSGTVRAPAARTGSAARAPVKAVGGSAFMPAKLASKMTMKSSLAGAFRVRLAFGGGEALHRARAPVVVVPYRITGSGGLADVGLSSEPLAPRFPAPSIPTFFMPASFRVSLTNPTFPVIHSAQASPCLPPWRLASPLWAVVLWS